MATAKKKVATKKPTNTGFGDYVENSVKATGIQASIKELKAELDTVNNALAKSGPVVAKAIADNGGGMVVGDMLLTLTKGGAIRTRSVAVIS